MPAHILGRLRAAVPRVQKYVNGFAHCLMLCNGNEQSPAYPRLLMLLAETRALKLTFCMLRPVRLVHSHTLYRHIVHETSGSVFKLNYTVVL